MERNRLVCWRRIISAGVQRFIHPDRDKTAILLIRVNGLTVSNDDPAANRKLDGFLSMPWKAGNRELVEETLISDRETEYVDMLFLGKFYGYGDNR